MTTGGFSGLSYLENKQPDKALPALNQALAIRPYQPDTQFGLAEIYRLRGNLTLSNEYRAKALWLMKRRNRIAVNGRGVLIRAFHVAAFLPPNAGNPHTYSTRLLYTMRTLSLLMSCPRSTRARLRSWSWS